MVALCTKSNLKACTLAAFALMAWTVNANAATYYVDNTGGNNTNPGTLAQPWETITYANSQVTAGDTVYIRAGTYNETIRPDVSGTSGNYITFSRYGSETVTITGVAQAADLSDRSYIIVDGIRAVNVTDRSFVIYNGHYNTVRNCYSSGAPGWGSIRLQEGSSYNRILNNAVTDGHGDPIEAYNGHHNLFEGNVVDGEFSTHGGIVLRYEEDCVVRNNIFKNADDDNLNMVTSKRILIEGNVAYGAGQETTRNGDTPAGTGMKNTGGEYYIYRRNVSYDNPSAGLHHYSKDPASSFSIIGIKAYHNTFYNNGRSDKTWVNGGISEVTYAAVPNHGNVWVNNIVAENYNDIFFGGTAETLDGFCYNNVFASNLLNPANGTTRISYLAASYTLDQAEQVGFSPYVRFANNKEGDPLFVNEAERDFALRPGSAAIDAGVFLTRITSGGSGTEVPLEDAGYFCDGFGIVDGDQIQLEGQTQIARIISVDYDNNRITVDSTLTWNAGQGVSLPYHGSAPDIGAFEYVSAGTTYTLSVGGTNGSVAKTPDQGSYDAGETVTLQAVADAGYEFTGWSGDLSGSANPATITMDANKSVTANFAAAAAPTYTLNTTATNGSVTKTPDQGSYDEDETVTLQAVADAGYEFTGWSGDLSGSTNPATIVMDADKSVTANFAAIPTPTYTLSTAATNGSVTKTPDQGSYDEDETVTLQAVADTGYEFSGWSGDLSGSTNPATIVMDADKSVTANFAAVATPTYTLAAGGANGSVAKDPDKSNYTYGETVVLTATPNTGYSFANWSGDASGTSPSTTITMDANKSVTANFTANTYTLATGGANGSVAKDPDKSSYTHGETVSLQAVANSGYEFTGWSGDLSGSANPSTVTMTANKTVTANFAAEAIDETPPVLASAQPEPDAVQVPLNALVMLHVSDDGEGVDAEAVTISINDTTVYSGDVSSYSSASGVCRRTGTEADYAYAYQSDTPFDFDEAVTVTVDATDLADNVMTQYSYSFKTEMRSFGANELASGDKDSLEKGSPETVGDTDGNIWVTWEEGPAGARDVYVGKRAHGAGSFDDPARITTNEGDQANPAIGIGSDDQLYVVWQDNRRGNWDVYLSTSTDGVNWSEERLVTDSNSNDVNPVVVVDGQSPNRAYVAWQSDRDGSHDIFVASSINAFVDHTVSQVTAHAADQTDPDMAVDGLNNVYVVWTDARNDQADVYGAASNEGPWNNVPIVTASGSQTEAVVAVAPGGSILHVLWVDDRPGDSDIYYAWSEGLPDSPLGGSSIVDDTLGADQIAPAIVCAGDGKALACWQDFRHANLDGSDSDLFLADLQSGSAQTNVLIGDEGTNSSQAKPAIGIDFYGHPYVVWIDDRNATTDVYYAGSTFTEPVPLDSQLVTESAGGTVGVPPADISSVDDVSVVIPAQACPFDVTVTISRIFNPPGFPTESLGCYEFGPSGLEFAQPVTVTIPYATQGNGKVKAYWYDSLTGSLSEQGITDIVDTVVGPGLRALQFKTTHFTSFYLVSVPETDSTSTDGSSGGGGGCSLSVHSGSDPVGYFIPYMLIAAIMVGLRFKDAKRRI